MNAEEIRAILDPFDKAHYDLECDGFTTVASYHLRKAGIRHACMIGGVVWNGCELGLHCWIVAGDFVIDYRMGMWLGDTAPHGVFKLSDHPDLHYDGKPYAPPADEIVIRILMLRPPGVLPDRL